MSRVLLSISIYFNMTMRDLKLVTHVEMFLVTLTISICCCVVHQTFSSVNVRSLSDQATGNFGVWTLDCCSLKAMIVVLTRLSPCVARIEACPVHCSIPPPLRSVADTGDLPRSAGSCSFYFPLFCQDHESFNHQHYSILSAK